MYLVSLPQAVNNVLCVIDSNHHFVKPEKKTLSFADRDFLFSDYVFNILPGQELLQFCAFLVFVLARLFAHKSVLGG